MPALPERSQPVIDFLSNRRSNLAKIMADPGPNAQELDDILTIATRVPDHRKLEPWRLILFQGDKRKAFGDELATIFKNNTPEAPQDRIDFEAARLLRAPLVIAVISAPVDDPRGTPEWEQRLSSAIVCYNLCLGAQAHGYAAQWLTEWYAYDSEVKTRLELQDSEKISGFIYIGTATETPQPRKRPILKQKVIVWGES